MNKEAKRKFALPALLLFSLSMLFASPGADFHKKGHKNFHGKRMIEKEDGDFSLIFVKATQIEDSFSFGLVFSQPVNPASISNENILLNGNKIELTSIRFSKNYRNINFFINAKDSILKEENTELVIKDIESISGKKIEPIAINNFKPEEDYRLIRTFER